MHSNNRSLNDLKKEYNIEIKQLNNTTKEIYFRTRKENTILNNTSTNSFNENYIKNIEIYGLNVDTLNKLKRKIENCKILSD
jgi:hypothetical protein